MTSERAYQRQIKWKYGNKDRKRKKGNSNQVPIRLKKIAWERTDERERVEHAAADQTGRNTKWWEWGDQEFIQRLRTSRATGFTGSCQLDLCPEPVSSQWRSPLLKPHHTERGSVQSICSLCSSCVSSAPTGPLQVPTDSTSAPGSANTCVGALGFFPSINLCSPATTGGNRKIPLHAATRRTDGK